MKLTFVVFLAICVHKPILLDAKIDTGILLIIESSMQNKDYDVLCALRDAISSLMQRDDVLKGDADLILTYIDKLHDCFTTQISSEFETLSLNKSVSENVRDVNDMMEIEEFLGEENGLGIDYYEHGEAEEFRQKMEDASKISERANNNVISLKGSIIGIAVTFVVIAGLFFVGVCFAGRIVIKSCKGKQSRVIHDPVADSSSFTFENENV